jgi:hypothetical protein
VPSSFLDTFTLAALPGALLGVLASCATETCIIHTCRDSVARAARRNLSKPTDPLATQRGPATTLYEHVR